MPRLNAEWTGDFDEVRRIAAESAGAFDAPFARRFAAHFPTLHPLFVRLYGERDDGLEQLAAVVGRSGGIVELPPPRAEGPRRSARAESGLVPVEPDARRGLLRRPIRRRPSGRSRQHPLLRGTRPDLPAPHAAVREPRGQFRRRVCGVELPARESRDRHDGRPRRAGGRPAAGRNQPRRGLHLQPHQQRARVGAQGRLGRPGSTRTST